MAGMVMSLGNSVNRLSEPVNRIVFQKCDDPAFLPQSHDRRDAMFNAMQCHSVHCAFAAANIAIAKRLRLNRPPLNCGEGRQYSS